MHRSIMAPQVDGPSNVCSTVSITVGTLWGSTGGFPSQWVSNAECVSISWCHQVTWQTQSYSIWQDFQVLTYWGRVTHICIGKLTNIGSDNGLLPGRHQAIIWTSAGILLIGPLGTNFSEILIGIQTFSFKEMYLKLSSAKRRPFCLGLDVLTHGGWVTHPSEKHANTASPNGLLPGQPQAIIWTNAAIL